MRVLVIASRGRSLLNFRGPLLRALRAAGHEVLAASPDDHPGLGDALDDLGVRWIPVAMRNTGKNPFEDARVVGALVALMRRERPDLVLAYTIKPVIDGGIAARIARVPRFVALITGLGHVFVVESRRGRLLREAVAAAYRIAVARAYAVIFQNPDDRDEFVRRRVVDADRTVVVAGSGVDLERFVRSPAPSDPVVFLFVGRFLVDKGITDLIDAIRLLRARGRRPVVRLVGATHANPSSVGDAEVRGWVDEGLVELVGWVDDVRPALRDASVLVFPGRGGEGTPRSALEALATGRAVITTRTPGCRETVRDGVNGFIVEPRDPAAFADRMERFLDDPGLVRAMGDASYALAVEKYDVNKVNAAMLAAMGLA